MNTRIAGFVGAWLVVIAGLEGTQARAAEPTEKPPIEAPVPSPDAPVAPPPVEAPKPDESKGRGKAKPRVIELEAMVIEGKVAKPQVFYVLGRSRVQYENLKMQRVFVDRIIDGAKKNPF